MYIHTVVGSGVRYSGRRYWLALEVSILAAALISVPTVHALHAQYTAASTNKH